MQPAAAAAQQQRFFGPCHWQWQLTYYCPTKIQITKVLNKCTLFALAQRSLYITGSLPAVACLEHALDTRMLCEKKKACNQGHVAFMNEQPRMHQTRSRTMGLTVGHSEAQLAQLSVHNRKAGYTNHFDDMSVQYHLFPQHCMCLVQH